MDQSKLSHTLNSAMEDLSVSQKQLPFRQQKEKPLLKYSTSEPGPIYLYQDVEPDSSSAKSIPETPKKVVTNRKSSLSGDPSTSSKHFNSAQYGYVPPPDPYARPLSAKSLMTLGLERTKSLNHIMSTTLAGNLANSMHSTNVNNNTIFKPSKNVDILNPIQDTPFSSSTSTQSNAISTTKVVSVASPETNTTRTQSAKEKFEASLSKPPVAPERGTRPPSSLRRPQSSTVRNPNYSPSKPYEDQGPSEDEDFKMVSDTNQKPKKKTDDNLNNKITKAISSLSRTMVSERPNGLIKPSSSNESLNENLKTQERSSVKASLVAKPTSLTKPEVLDSVSFPSSLPKSRSTPSNMSALENPIKKNGKRLDSPTTYYLKSSKPELKIAEPRPACEGRDSMVTEMSKPSGLKALKSSSIRTVERVSVPTPISSSRQTARGASSLTTPSSDTDEEEMDSASNLSERVPGDGEADDEFDDEEDDGIDGLEDDELEGPDDDLDSLASTSTSGARNGSRARSASFGANRVQSNQSQQPIRMKSARRRTHSSYHEHSIQPAFIKSLFPHVPPYLNFIGPDEKIELLPWEYRRMLKWRMCSITPTIVRQLVARSGFRPTKKQHDWLGCWGRHMKAQGFKSIREYQKLNHFPGSFQIGRKDRLWRNLSRLQVSFGKREFNFFPTTYVLPYDMKGLKRAWEDGGSKGKWIIKPPASARGIGIKVINKWNQIPKKRPVIVQKYLARPLLINESKFDCRVYVYVTSYDPLRIYVYEDGLVRFCSTKYSHAMKHINDKYMHLTNYSIQKKNNEYESNADDTVCQGHKWSLKALWGYLLKKGVNSNEIWKNIKDLVVKTIICADSSINSFTKSNVRNRYSVHELFGFDILLDETYKPWVLEVNISPSLHSNSQLDINIKGAMVRDIHNLAGFRVPDKADVVPNPSSETYKPGPPTSKYCMDKRVFPQTLSSDEKAKHSYYSQRHQDDAAMSSIIDILTPDDLRILIESIDEDSRKGSFQRVFPTPSTHRYLGYFETQRYYNLFLDHWCQRFNRVEAKGIALIEAACRNKIHLQNPTTDPRHQWCPPSGRISLSSSQLSMGVPSGANGLAKLKKQVKKSVEGNSGAKSTRTLASRTITAS